MKLTSDNLKSLIGTEFALFIDSKFVRTFKWGGLGRKNNIVIAEYHDSVNADPIEYFVLKYELQEADIFLLSDIRMPCTQTADIQEKLNGIEVKSKTCSQWFSELPEGTLKDAVLACKDEHLSNERKAIDIFDAIECGCFLSADEASQYLRKVLDNRK